MKEKKENFLGVSFFEFDKNSNFVILPPQTGSCHLKSDKAENIIRGKNNKTNKKNTYFSLVLKQNYDGPKTPPHNTSTKV